jgi:APA family basic amino acid/polyamine antiporter
MFNRNNRRNPALPPLKTELRRDVTVWGSFMWGYADVGADVYVALGLVMAAAQGATNLAFALAGLVYIMIGLAYTELASAYPVAGGGQFFTLRGLGDFWGFVAGSALLLDYTIDIALFSYASAGYVNFFFPSIAKFSVSIGPFHNINPIWALESLAIIVFLVWINILGIRQSSLLNEILGAVDIITESTIIIMGFVFAWKPEMLVSQWKMQFPSLSNFMYGSSLAIISYVGLESISQAAQETRRPATIIPRTSLSLIFTVFIFATAFSTLSLGVLSWQDIASAEANPVARLASVIPYIGVVAGPFAALLGATILLISSNSGVMSASRVTFSMSQLKLIHPWFDAVHPKYQTPVRTIVFFSLMGALETLLAALTPRAMDTLGNLYAFGATLGYFLVFISLMKLRFSDPYTPRPYMMPGNITINRDGIKIKIPILGLFGILGVSTILFEVILTHTIGRIAGPAWVLLCAGYYLYFRRSNGLPLFKSIKRDWERETIEVLTGAEEYELVETYKQTLKERDEMLARRRAEGKR